MGTVLVQSLEPDQEVPINTSVNLLVLSTLAFRRIAAATRAPNQKATPLPIALDSLGDNLWRVFYYDLTTEDLTFYDPRPEFARVNNLFELVDGQIYCLKVSNDQGLALNGKERRLFAGFNTLRW